MFSCTFAHCNKNSFPIDCWSNDAESEEEEEKVAACKATKPFPRPCPLVRLPLPVPSNNQPLPTLTSLLMSTNLSMLPTCTHVVTCNYKTWTTTTKTTTTLEVVVELLTERSGTCNNNNNQSRDQPRWPLLWTQPKKPNRNRAAVIQKTQ